MKSFKMLLIAAFSIVTFSAFAQDSANKKMHTKEHQVEGISLYACPMKCEGDKTYDKAGKCPSCGMNLKEKVKSTALYSCPMKCEGDKTFDKAGKCPSCGMNLKEKVKSTVLYSCPMKCEADKTHDKPGSCSKCGMDLTKVKTKTKKD